MHRNFVVALLLIGGIALVTPTARAQNSTDTPGMSLHPVTSAGEIGSATSWAPSSQTLWQALGIVLQQNLPAGLWQRLSLEPVRTAAPRTVPVYVAPRRTSVKLGGLIRS